MADLNKLNDEDFDNSFHDNLSNQKSKEEKNIKPLTQWKKEPKLRDLKSDFEQTKNSHANFISNLDRWSELFDPEKFGGKNHKGSRIVPKLVRKQAEWRKPALSEPFLSATNLYEVRPLTYEDTPRAKQNALILNRQFNTQIKKVKLVDKIIHSLVKNGTAIVRTGWETKEKKVKEKVMQYKYSPVDMNNQQLVQQLQQQYQQLGQLKKTSPDSYESQTPPELKAGFEMSQKKNTLLAAQATTEIEQEKTIPVINRPTVEVCNLKNVYIDPTCNGDLDKAQFIIHSFESSYSDLKKAGYYKNLDKLNDYQETNTIDHDSDNEARTFKFTDKARKKLVVYEYWGYWDIHGTGETESIVASWVGDTLIRLEENPFPDGEFPFVVFEYIPEEDSIYGIPDAELLEDNQAIIGAVTRGMIDLMGKSANSQTGYSKGFLDATNKIKFKAGEDYEYNPNFDPRVHIFTHKYPDIPNSAMQTIQMMNNEAESISGVKAFSGSGITGADFGDVAAGIRGVLDAVSKREMSILRRVIDGFIKVGRKIIAMNSEFLSEEEVIRITNEEFIKVRREDLAGDFDLVLTISTAEVDDAKAKELAFMVQTIGNNMGTEITQMMLSEIADLRKMPDLAKKIIDYKPQPDEMQQQMQQLQMQKLQADIALVQAQAQEAQAKSQVQSAKVGTEQAKASSLQGDADNKTLDFAQKDSGISHQKELDKLHAQNQGAIAQQFAKSDGESQQLDQQHNSDLLQSLAQHHLTTQQNEHQAGLDSVLQAQSNPLAMGQ